ncbi:MAG: oxaloacetate decarboxylase [Clostridia bacterium]|jgi:hypothetical protein|nr:oxaloacetate decarboxylase [Clostridia bacterium]
MTLNIENFIASLKYMWQGMLCIFVVIGVIILSVYLIGAITAKADERKKAKQENTDNN